VYLSGIEEVEYLHHDKSIEDECEVARVNSFSLINSFIVRIARYGDHSAGANSSSHYAIVPFPLWMGCKVSFIVAINLFGNETFTPEYKHS